MSLLEFQILVACVVIFVILELRYPLTRNRTPFTWSYVKNFQYQFFNHAFYTLFFIALAKFGFYLGQSYRPTIISRGHVLIQGLISVFVIDFLSTLHHRYVLHSVPFMRRSHEIHHSTTHFDLAGGLKVNPLDNVFIIPLNLWILSLMGISPMIAGSSFFFVHIWTYLSHLNLRIDMKWLNHIIVNHQYHRLHHHLSGNKGGVNFTSVFPVIDRMIGTQKIPEGVVAGEVGSTRVPNRENYFRDFIHPFRRRK